MRILQAALPLCLLTLVKVTLGALGPLPCHGFLAFCHRPYNSSRMEGERALERPPQNMTKEDFRDHRCFCDEDCRRHGDCCPDGRTSEDVQDDGRHLEELEDAMMMDGGAQERREWECHAFPAQEIAVYMIGSCPEGYGNAFVQNRCRRHVPPSAYGYALDLPVLSRTTNLTYVNVFCALCNGDSSLHPWSLVVYCPLLHPNCTQDTDAWRYQPGEKRWKILTPDNKTEVITYEVQDSDSYLRGHGLRRCREEVIVACPVSWKDSRERALCLSYALIVKAQNSSRLYKNEHCAICNGESDNRMLCPKTVHEPPPVGHLPQWTDHSFAVLLDFLGEGSRVGETGVCGVSGLLCGFGELCDPVHRKCLAYSCGRKYHMDAEGLCVPQALVSTSGDLPSLDSDCPKVLLTSGEYARHPNGSVTVRSSGQRHDGGQYEAVNASAILVCASPEALLWKFSSAQSILSKACISLSLLCLTAHMVIQLVTPALLNLPGKNLLCLSASLFLAQLCFEFGLGVTTVQLCVAVALLVHFSFLSAFLWMNVMAVDVFRTFAAAGWRPRSRKKDFRLYSLYAWSTALSVVLAALANDAAHWLPGYEPAYGHALCWISNRRGLLLFFAAPLAVILVVNVVLFSLTVVAICRTRRATKLVREASSDVCRTLLYVKLALIMGLTWSFGFLAALTDVEALWYVFILLNSLQGAFIFVAFSCKRSVLSSLPPWPCRRIRGSLKIRIPPPKSSSEDAEGQSPSTAETTQEAKSNASETPT